MYRTEDARKRQKPAYPEAWDRTGDALELDALGVTIGMVVYYGWGDDMAEFAYLYPMRPADRSAAESVTAARIGVSDSEVANKVWWEEEICVDVPDDAAPGAAGEIAYALRRAFDRECWVRRDEGHSGHIRTMADRMSWAADSVVRSGFVRKALQGAKCDRTDPNEYADLSNF